MISETVIQLTRWQFAITSSYQFLFTALTVGLALLLALTDSAYVISGQSTYKSLNEILTKLFAVNMMACIATSLAMQFQFGTNWAYLSHYVGDILGLILAFGNMGGLFILVTSASLLLFGADKLTKQQHLLISWLLVLGSHVFLFGLVVANTWLEHPVGAEFNYQSLRMELTDFSALFNQSVGIKFTHILASAYSISAALLLTFSTYWLSKNEQNAIAQQSYSISARFGLVTILSAILLGYYSSNSIIQTQTAKASAIAGSDNQASLIAENQHRITNGIKVYNLLQDLRDNKNNPQLLTDFAHYQADLGYGLLLKAYTEDISQAKQNQIDQAAATALPKISLVFISFRIMVASGLYLLFILSVNFLMIRRKLYSAWLNKLNLYSLLPLTILAAAAGWIVSESGRQPWAVAEILPTFLSISSVSGMDLALSLTGYVIVYHLFLGVMVFFGLKLIQQNLTSAAETI